MNLISSIFIFLIKGYQRFISPLFVLLFGHACKYPESCSNYTIRQIQEKGVIAGTYKGIVRFVHCR